MKTLGSTLVPLALVTLMAGCAANADDGSASSTQDMTGAAPFPTATVATKEIRANTSQCHVSIDWPVVTVPSAEVTAKIAKALEAPVLAAICEGVDDETSIEHDGSYTVELNKSGLLSISFGESMFMTGMSSMGNSWHARTFDISTGAELKLGDVLTPAALEKAKADCMAELDEFFCGGHFDADVIAQERQRFMLRDDGLVILAKVPEEFVIPWSKLPAASFKPGPVAAWRATAK